MVMMLCIWASYRFLYKPGRILKQLGNPVIADAQTPPDGRRRGAAGEHSGRGAEANRRARAIVRRGDRQLCARQLIRAGFRSENAAPVFFGVRIVAVVAMLMVCIIVEPNLSDNQMMKIAFMVSGCMAAWVLPRFFLEKQVKKRQETLRLSLPDALDMLVVSVEAGLGLDQAVQHVAKEIHISHPQLSEEMQMVTLEMRAGKRRSEAMRNLAERTGEPEIRKLVAILIQNDRFGTSMGESLRHHSDFMRTRRKQDAEERAGKVGVKLVFPIFFFILPSMVVVAAGPGVTANFQRPIPHDEAHGRWVERRNAWLTNTYRP